MKLAHLLTVLTMLPIGEALHAAQDSSSTNDTQSLKKELIPLDDRGGLPVPENLHDIKNLSLAFWIKFRGTSQRLYRYINEAAQFHAYSATCKRHELNISLGPITELAHRYIQATIPAHYAEPEFALLDPLSKKQQQEFLEDMASDVYAFEYGFRTAEHNREIEQSGKTRKTFCEEIEAEYKQSYIALRATALKRLAEFEDMSLE